MNKYLVRLSGEIYDLRKIKEVDKEIFLDGCMKLGTYKKVKGFWNKVCKLFILFYTLVPQLEPTVEYRKAYWFFKKQEELKERELVEKKFQSWRKKNE